MIRFTISPIKQKTPKGNRPGAFGEKQGFSKSSIGPILPGALDIAPDLTEAAAGGIAVIMLLAAIFHATRKETQGVVMTVVLLLIALLVVVGRLGFEPF